MPSLKPQKGRIVQATGHMLNKDTGDMIRDGSLGGLPEIQDLIVYGKVGIYTRDPQVALHVVGDRIRLQGSADKILDLRADGGALDLQTQTNDLYIRSTGHNINLNPLDEDGNVGIKTGNPQATLDVNGSIRVSGDIILLNADCAEDFDIPTEENIDPGTVMVLTENGGLAESRVPYDKKVAGVVAGAGDLKPGIVLNRQPGNKRRIPIALTGRVYAKVDADQFPVEVGDLLTTSPTPGHAMRAADPNRAFGAVIGKALQPLTTGRRLIQVLVALQ